LNPRPAGRSPTSVALRATRTGQNEMQVKLERKEAKRIGL
jgi:hypothetical protein